MTEQDRAEFFMLVGDVYAFWKQDFSAAVGRVWWNAMKHYDLAAIEDGFGRWSVNPDGGAFCPRPSEILKMMNGSTADAAFVAWSLVDKAVRMVGPYQSVVFDDPLTHCVIHEMGGWILLTQKDDEAWPFVRNEFVTRYRGYRARSEVPTYPATLVGLAQAQNSQLGHTAPPPLLLGDPNKAAMVMHCGAEKVLLNVTSVAALLAAPVKQLEARRAA